jgi:hypothetical protein
VIISTAVFYGGFIGISSVFHRYLIDIVSVLYRYRYFFGISSAFRWYVIGILSVLIMLGFTVVHVKVVRQ